MQSNFIVFDFVLSAMSNPLPGNARSFVFFIWRELKEETQRETTVAESESSCRRAR